MAKENQYEAILKNPTNRDRFYYDVDKGNPNECWPWKRCCNFAIMLAGGKVISFKPSRVALTLAVGPPPTNKENIRHTCRNRRCCNPKHLRWATGKIKA